MNFYWVNIGLSYKEVIKENFLWAPLYAERPRDSNDLSKGTVIRHYDFWDNVGLVKAGDIIFANLDRKIVFVAVAKTDAFQERRPITRAFDQWGQVGNKVPIEIFHLPTKVSVDGNIHEAFRTRFNANSRPTVFKKNGQIFQGYMAAIPDAAGLELLCLAEELEADVVETSDRLGRKYQGGRKMARPKGTSGRQAIREARIGQGYFRQQLLEMWKACPITGVANPNLLLASHTKPWAKSNDEERLDPYNGFLFSPHIDRLFDKGLISFGENGGIIVSPALTRQDQKALGIHLGLKILLKQEHKKYLEEHRKIFGL